MIQGLAVVVAVSANMSLCFIGGSREGSGGHAPGLRKSIGQAPWGCLLSQDPSLHLQRSPRSGKLTHMCTHENSFFQVIGLVEFLWVSFTLVSQHDHQSPVATMLHLSLSKSAHMEWPRWKRNLCSVTNKGFTKIKQKRSRERWHELHFSCGAKYLLSGRIKKNLLVLLKKSDKMMTIDKQDKTWKVS